MEKLLKDTPDDTILGEKLIKCHLELKNYDNALNTAENLMSNMPDDVMKHFLIGSIGEIYYRMGNIHKAIRQIETALNFFKTSKASDLAEWDTLSSELKEQMKKQYQIQIKTAISVYEETLLRYKKDLDKKGA